MGFLAYLLVGGIVGAAASYYFPGFSPRNKAKSSRKTTKWVYLWGILLGVMGAILASYGGQIMGLFTSGQMSEWASAVLGAFLISQVFFLLKEY
jgi:uncharacterized membrane protein YeaQ/YmgE (transglycosylase-associated protein family)